MAQYDWYFDVISPFAYLQWKTRHRFSEQAQLRPVPILFGPLLNHWGNQGPAEVPVKQLHVYRNVLWRAAKAGVPMRIPQGHPFNPLGAMRLIVAAGATEQVIDAVFDAIFRDGRDVSDPETLAAIGMAAGVDNPLERIQEPGVKSTLRANVEQAIARGVFGVPTIIANGELFWGEDSTGMFLDYLANPDLFKAPAMAELGTVRTTATR